MRARNELCRQRSLPSANDITHSQANVGPRRNHSSVKSRAIKCCSLLQSMSAKQFAQSTLRRGCAKHPATRMHRWCLNNLASFDRKEKAVNAAALVGQEHSSRNSRPGYSFWKDDKQRSTACWISDRHDAQSDSAFFALTEQPSLIAIASWQDMTCAGVLASLISIGSQSHISECGAMVFDFPALRLSLNRAEDQVKPSIGIGHDGSCELHRLQSSGTAKTLGAWFAQDRAHARGRERRHGCAARSDRRLKGRPDGLAIPRQQAASGLDAIHTLANEKRKSMPRW